MYPYLLIISNWLKNICHYHLFLFLFHDHFLPLLLFLPPPWSAFPSPWLSMNVWPPSICSERAAFFEIFFCIFRFVSRSFYVAFCSAICPSSAMSSSCRLLTSPSSDCSKASFYFFNSMFYFFISKNLVNSPLYWSYRAWFLSSSAFNICSYFFISSSMFCNSCCRSLIWAILFSLASWFCWCTFWIWDSK